MPTTVPNFITAATIDGDRYRAAREHCRRQWPDLFFASHFTSRPRRYALYAIAAVAHQFAEIMGLPQVGVNPPAIVSAQAASCCSSGSCEGESIGKRQDVCLAVIDHLLGGQLTGKPELDSFLDVQPVLRLPREWFETWVKGMATERMLPRYATSRRLNDTVQQSAGMPMMMMARALSETSDPFSSVVQSQLLAWGGAMRWCDLLHEVKADWGHGRVMLPLDDLIRHRLMEKDIATFASQSTTQSDPRWQTLMQFELERVRSLFRGGSKALSVLVDEGARRTFAAIGVFALRRLEKLIAKGGDPFAMQVKMSTMHRLAAMPRVVRMVWEERKAENQESRKAGH